MKLTMNKIYLPDTIESKRLSIRRNKLEWADTIFSTVVKDREHLQPFLTWVDKTQTLDDQKKYLEKTTQEWENYSGFDYAIFIKENNLYAGNIGLHTISWENKRTEIGYWITKEFENKGFITEAVKALEKIIFASSFHRIEIRCDPTNKRSANVARRCGYSLEGKLNHDVIQRGEYRDTLIFAKLGKE